MRFTTRTAALGALLALASTSACKATQQSAVFGEGGGGTNATGAGTGGTATGAGGGVGGDIGPIGTGGGGNGSTGVVCNAGDNEDRDKDGFTKLQGDCNDCDPNVNPNAVEVLAVPDENGVTPPPADEDCDGVIDNLPTSCDTGLAGDSIDAMDAAKAVELCPPTNPIATWGVKNAQWVRADGNPNLPGGNQLNNFHLGHGIINGFGPNVNVQGGTSFLVLSSGTARTPGQPGYKSPGGFDKGYTGAQPDTGFPKESPACPGAKTGEVHDDTAVELTIQTPANAHGFAFMFNFFTYEWPGYICSTFNDFFVAILKPNLPGFPDGNISFDAMGNAVSVNNGLLEVCGPPGTYGGKSFACPLGVAGLQGTGFEGTGGFLGDGDHGSTYWLATQAPTEPNTEIRIRWAVYDSGDGVLDSTTIIDNWQWIATAGTQVGTGHVDIPK
jgi:hypothetical protein